MRQKLKDLFGKVSSGLKRNTIVTVAGGTMALSPGLSLGQGKPVIKPESATIVQPQDDPPNINKDTLYWKHKDYDIVVKTWPCEERGLCASIHSFSLKDEANRKLMAELKGYTKEQRVFTGGRGGFTSRRVPDASQVEDWEMEAYCGYQANAKLSQKDNGTWSGTITSPFNWQSYGLDVRQLDNDTIRLSGYFTSFPLIKLSEKAKRVETPPPSCMPETPGF